jgi:hypothetical protein
LGFPPKADQPLAEFSSIGIIFIWDFDIGIYLEFGSIGIWDF